MILNAKKDITTIKEEVLLGKSWKETIIVAIGMAISVISVIVMIFGLKMPVYLSTNLGMLFSMPVYIFAFVRLYGLNVFVLIKKVLGFHLGSQTTYYYVGLEEENLRELTKVQEQQGKTKKKSNRMYIYFVLFIFAWFIFLIFTGVLLGRKNNLKSAGITAFVTKPLPLYREEPYQVSPPGKSQKQGFLSWRVVSKTDKSFIADTNWVYQEWSKEKKRYIVMWPQPKTYFFSNTVPAYGVTWKGSLASDWLTSTKDNEGWFKVVQYQAGKEILTYETSILKDSPEAKIYTHKDGKTTALAKRDLIGNGITDQKISSASAAEIQNAQRKAKSFAKENAILTIMIQNKEKKYATGEVEISMNPEFTNALTVPVSNTSGYQAAFSRKRDENIIRYIRLKSLMGQTVANTEVKKTTITPDQTRADIVFEVDIDSKQLQEKIIQEWGCRTS